MNDNKDVGGGEDGHLVGRTVRVREIVVYVATCSEPGCGWAGPHRTYRPVADGDATAHYREHARRTDR